jgi:hypothetical protein
MIYQFPSYPTPKTIGWLAGIGLLLMVAACHSKKAVHPPPSIINTAHLDKLYEEIKMGEDTVGIIHIYSEYPDYHLVGDPDEGMTCVDDVSRAAIFYMLRYRQTDSLQYLHKAKMLTKFILAMQAKNGYYYNFLWPGANINTNGLTSKAEPSWWAWRALWALGVVNNYLVAKDSLLSTQITQQQSRLILNVLREPQFRSNKTDTIDGFVIPAWLPKGSGTDQASVLMMGLLIAGAQEEFSPLRDSIITFIHHMADGIMMMQIHSPDSLQDGAFLSWSNLWHAYGNIQAFTLLTVGQELLDTTMILAGMYEVDHFYPAILASDGFDQFWVNKKGNTVTRYAPKTYSQIAYGRSPMIWAALQAHALSGETDKKYLSLAGHLAMWFLGNNPAKAMMYDPATGRGYDGINGPGDINKNSGAESTVEALLVMQALEMYNLYYDPGQKKFIAYDLTQ